MIFTGQKKFFWPRVGNLTWTLRDVGFGVMNGFRSFYARIGSYFFSHQAARDVVTEYYQQLLEVLANDDAERVILVVRKYGIESGKIWQQVRQDLPTNIVD